MPRPGSPFLQTKTDIDERRAFKNVLHFNHLCLGITPLPELQNLQRQVIAAPTAPLPALQNKLISRNHQVSANRGIQ
jgi:hypothetical protein